MASSSTSSKVIVAVTQAEPVWLDLDATVDKTCALITEAAKNGAKILAFPEAWIPGYPAWIWSRPMDPELTTRYIQNSLKLDSPQAAKIKQCAAENSIVVVLGFSENVNGSLYISQAIIDADGEVRLTRNKMKATHMERTIFGDSFGYCLDSVTDTEVGRVGALNCWEHLQPLLKYHLYSQKEQIHVASWLPVHKDVPEGALESMSHKGISAIAQVYAIESQSFVLHSTTVITQPGLDLMGITRGPLMSTPGGGNSAVFGPDGSKLSVDIPEDEEGIVYATIDLDDVLKARAFIDTCGHYSRPDLLWLGVDKEIKRHVRDL
ncbi:Nitrilase/cyanide hydratase and apolipoprotein N-acyltransferase [Beauveria brongniartii RCEF 3172]|uniref:nitrilase n=1 Tax=Beauveria brongniartii RCEF 3172 TaxID=1081107 RepID=A0A167G064_9HYPO|nr:Nitrilase/cyanide hydratase and apolipoprotein N-acyltransferase [Beauveria brongniartii RCEF 3172]